MSAAVVVLVTAGSAQEAERIARTLVEERLVACANVVGGLRSIYRWKGKITRESEWLLVLKTRSRLFTRVEKRVRALHSYEVPEVIALEVTAGSAPYLDWIRTETS